MGKQSSSKFVLLLLTISGLRIFSMVMFFNHFTRCQGILTMPKLVQAWNRDVALMCKPCTPRIDHVIPVMLPGEAEEFSPLHQASWNDAHIERARKRVSYIVINSKNYTSAKNWNRSVLDITADESDIVGSKPLGEKKLERQSYFKAQQIREPSVLRRS